MADRFRNITGTRIREIRIRRDWTQGDLAVRLQRMGLLNIDRTGVAKMESGIRSIYDYELAIVAEALGVTTGALFPDTSEIQENLPRLIGGRFDETD